MLDKMKAYKKILKNYIRRKDGYDEMLDTLQKQGKTLGGMRRPGSRNPKKVRT